MLSIELYEDKSALERYVVLVRFPSFPDESYAVTMWENPEEGSTYVHPIEDVLHRIDVKYSPDVVKRDLSSLPVEHTRILCGYLSRDVGDGRISGGDLSAIPSGILAVILSSAAGGPRNIEDFEAYPPPGEF